MIKSIRFCVNHGPRIRKLGQRNAQIRFQPGYNVLIGPNGSGKSTVLKALASCTLCRLDRTDSAQTKYITTETLNPLVGGTFSTREQMVQGIRALFQSHGQLVRDGLRTQAHGHETVVLLDTPETGQDLENCEYIYEGLREMARDFQVIVATNSLVFMRSGNLIDLGDGYLPRLLEDTRNLVAAFDQLDSEREPAR